MQMLKQMYSNNWQIPKDQLLLHHLNLSLKRIWVGAPGFEENWKWVVGPKGPNKVAKKVWIDISQVAYYFSIALLNVMF